MPKPTFTSSDLNSFCLLDGLGLTVTGQQVRRDRAILECRLSEDDPWCRDCGGEGVSRGTVVRKLAHLPLGWRPTTLWVRVRRYRCADCARLWRQDTSQAAAPRAKLSRHAVLWALKSVIIDRMSIARVAAALASSWHTVNDAVLAAGRQLLIEDPHRFEGVKVIGVDEHCWRHTGRGSHYVTVVIDLTPVRERWGRARLLDMVPGRSKAVFKTWLDAQSKSFRKGIEVVAMDGFAGFKTATAEELPEAVAVMDPSTWSHWPATPWISPGNAFSMRPPATAAALAIPSTGPGGPCAPALTCLPRPKTGACGQCSLLMSMSKSKPPGGSIRRS